LRKSSSAASQLLRYAQSLAPQAVLALTAPLGGRHAATRNESSLRSQPLWVLIVATLCAGFFAGAAIYINAVEHPARLSCGTELALREFAPSYRRATVMQAPLAIAGCVAGLWSAWVVTDVWLAVGAVLLGAVVPFTLVVILPTNNRLLDPSLDPADTTATELLVRGDVCMRCAPY
jgi:hypothetical protein